MNKLKWEQMKVTHCPEKDCKGMLLQNEYIYPEKCSVCGNIFLEVSEYKKLSKKEEDLEKEVFQNE